MRRDEECIKITILGCSFVGKTAIINRLVNNSFIKGYIPTKEIERYYFKMDLNDDEICKPLYANIVIEDTFGLDNYLLNKNIDFIQSKVLIQLKNKMTQEFKDIMFTAHEKRNKLLLEEENQKKHDLLQNSSKNIEIFNGINIICNEQIERNGFIFVCDCLNPKSVSSIIKIIDKFIEIEKTTNISYHKVILFNKCDKLKEKTFKSSMKKFQSILENYKKKSNINSVRISSLTGQGITNIFRKFLYKIHQDIKYKRQSKPIDDPEDDDPELKLFQPMCVDNVNSCSKKLLCGNKLLVCCERNIEEDEDNNKKK